MSTETLFEMTRKAALLENELMVTRQRIAEALSPFERGDIVQHIDGQVARVENVSYFTPATPRIHIALPLKSGTGEFRRCQQLMWDIHNWHKSETGIDPVEGLRSA